jgi:hypothetical protein
VRQTLLWIALCACHGDPRPIATLNDENGLADHAPSIDHWAWTHAKIGTRYFLGQSAQTEARSTATLGLGGGNASLQMQADTIVVFTGTEDKTEIQIRQGEIAVDNQNGTTTLRLGNGMNLEAGGKATINARDGRATIELTLGKGRVEQTTGTLTLTLHQPVEVARNGAVVADAGVPDAPVVVDAPAAPADAGDARAGATVAITGKRAELLPPGTTAWQPLPQGAGPLAPGSEVRVGAGTTAKLTAGGTTIDIASSARVKLTEDQTFELEQGPASVETLATASLALPGGALAFVAVPTAPAQARIDVGPRDSKVTMVRSASRLTGSAGAQLGLARGESALLTRAGTIRVLEAIPTYFDLRVPAGESLTLHDPKPPTSVQFQFEGKCADGGIIEVDRNALFRTAKVSAGREFANVMVPAGDYAYRLRCTTNGVDGGAVASGRIVARRDDGRRPLLSNPRVNDIDADGRAYGISYQSTIPNVAVHVSNAGATQRLHLASGGKEQTFDSRSSTIVVPGAQLHEGAYSYWIDRDGVKQDKVSRLTIDFDQTAPQAYLESPNNGQPWSGDIDVRGAVLPGWSASIDAIAIPIDNQRRFAAKVGPPSGNALAIRLSNPQRGVHYYLRRQK